MKIRWNTDFKKVPLNQLCFIGIKHTGILQSPLGKVVDGCEPYIETCIAKIKNTVLDDGTAINNFYQLNSTGKLLSYHMLCIDFDNIPQHYYGFSKYRASVAETYMYMRFGKVFDLSHETIWDGKS